MEQRCYGCMLPMEDGSLCTSCGWDQRRQNEPHQLQLGTVLAGRYLLGRVLGQGGFGITYIGWDLAAKLPVAVKEFFPAGQVMRECTVSAEVTSYSGDAGRYQESLGRFLREAKALAKFFDNPHIVRIYDYFEANHTAYIIMEYIRGETLRSYVQQQGRLTQRQTRELLLPVMEALSAVHEAGLLHRDISPDNIMLLPEGGAKLLDFGAVRSISGTTPGADPTKSTAAILKQGYAPLEQYRGKGDLGPWTDVYALCATVIFCLTGQTPPDAPERAMGEEEIDFTQVAPGAPELQTALEKGMALRTRDRTRSVAEFYEQAFAAALKKEQQERAAREKAEREAREKAERERIVREAKIKAEQERKERQAREKAEAARLAKEKAEKERKVREAAAAEKAAQKAAKEAEAAAARKKKEAEAAAAKQKKEAAVKERKETDAGKKKNPIFLFVILTLLCIGLVAAYLVPNMIHPNMRHNEQEMAYQEAVTLMEAGQFEEAIAAFEALDGYKDSAQQIEACLEGIQERAYQEAIALMEGGQYQDAMDIFIQLGDYKDSAAQAEACKEALLHIRKENALAMMEDGYYYYRSALTIFKEVHASGLDCSEEIRECELAILSGPQHGNHLDVKVVTSGEPISEEKEVAWKVEGNVTVHSLTRVDLDNGCVRYSIDCTPPNTEYVTFYSGFFTFWEEKGTIPGRQTFVFDVLKEDVLAAKKTGNGITVRFWNGKDGGDNYWIYIRNPY